MVRSGICLKEYKVGDVWTRQPEGIVTDVRYDVSRVDQELQDIGGIFRYIEKLSIESPENADKVRERIFLTRFNNSELILFSPWGSKYSNKDDLEAETITLQEIRDRLRRFRETNYKTNFLLMPADLYGTEINRLSESKVTEYFKRLSELAFMTFDDITSLTIKAWSQIREENDLKYQELKRQFDEGFDERIKKGLYERALSSAKIFGSLDPEDSARRYCIERLTEGYLIEEVYSPIKLSLVRKDKDILDGPLPRFYIIKNRAPWLVKDNDE